MACDNYDKLDHLAYKNQLHNKLFLHDHKTKFLVMEFCKPIMKFEYKLILNENKKKKWKVYQTIKAIRMISFPTTF